MAAGPQLPKGFAGASKAAADGRRQHFPTDHNRNRQPKSRRQPSSSQDQDGQASRRLRQSKTSHRKFPPQNPHSNPFLTFL